MSLTLETLFIKKWAFDYFTGVLNYAYLVGHCRKLLKQNLDCVFVLNITLLTLILGSKIHEVQNRIELVITPENSTLNFVCLQSLDEWVCETCDKSFKYKSWLAHHVKLSHQERRFNCDPCSKKFAHPSHLKDHLKSKEHKRNATLSSDDQAQATSEDPEELSGLAPNPHFSVNFSIFLSVTSSSMANSIHDHSLSLQLIGMALSC